MKKMHACARCKLHRKGVVKTWKKSRPGGHLLCPECLGVVQKKRAS